MISISDWEQKFVFSTGMYSINSKNNDYLLGFLLSNFFKKQKNMYASGTTMQAINNNTLKQIRIKNFQEILKTNYFSIFLSKLNFYEKYIKEHKKNCIDFLLK